MTAKMLRTLVGIVIVLTAWAVGTVERGVFRSTWHAERTPGSRPIPATLEAHVPKRRDLSVRVFCDDGSVGTWGGSAGRAEPEKAEVST